LVWRTEGKNHFEDVGVDGMVILKWIFTISGMEEHGWIALVQDRDSWRALVNDVMNFRVHKMRGIS
jgi:hypothetical protein